MDNQKLRVAFSDGRQFDVPARMIAENRAAVLVNTKQRENYDEVLAETLSSPELLIDWADNHMTWNDVANAAAPVAETVDEVAEWPTCPKSLVTSEPTPEPTPEPADA